MLGPTGNYVNGLFATVTVCTPGNTNCQTIDHVLVDTGSNGLRLLAQGTAGGLFDPTGLSAASRTPARTRLRSVISLSTASPGDRFRWPQMKMAGETATTVPGGTVAGVPVRSLAIPAFRQFPAAVVRLGLISGLSLRWVRTASWALATSSRIAGRDASVAPVRLMFTTPARAALVTATFSHCRSR